MEVAPLVRKPEGVLRTLNEAKINPASLNPLTQVLKFVDTEEDYLCLELPKELQETLESGNSLVIRGDKNDNAVLCTENKTYDLKDTETSNSLLILKTLKFPKDVKHLQESNTERTVEFRYVDKMIHNYLEPRLCRPRLHIIREILSNRPFKGPERETEFTMDLFSFGKLLSTVQASEEEIKNELYDIHAIEYKGFWRLLDFEYHFRVFSFMTNFIEQESMKLDEIDIESCCTAHENIVPREIFEQVCKFYTHPSLGKPGLYELKQDKVCRMVAESILKAAKKFNLDDFIPVWQESVIPGLKTELRQLTGLVIVEKSSSPPAIWYFPEKDLPEDINERLKRLFQERSSWPLDDIVPYMQKLATPQLPVNALLAKYARMSSKDGVKYFTGRHSK